MTTPAWKKEINKQERIIREKLAEIEKRVDAQDQNNDVFKKPLLPVSRM